MKNKQLNPKSYNMLKSKDGDFFISDWLRNRNTIEYLGIWEKIHNQDFNYGEHATITSKLGLNSYKLSVKDSDWLNDFRYKPDTDLKDRIGKFYGEVW